MPLGHLAETGGEGLVALGVEVLAGEEHHLPLEPDPPDGGHGGVVDVTEVQAADDRADRARKGGDVESDLGVDDGHADDPRPPGARRAPDGPAVG